MTQTRRFQPFGRTISWVTSVDIGPAMERTFAPDFGAGSRQFVE
jgi:hypothetical protein